MRSAGLLLRQEVLLEFSSIRHTALAAKGRVATTELKKYRSKRSELREAAKVSTDEDLWRRANWPLGWQTRLEKWFQATPYWVLCDAVDELKEKARTTLDKCKPFW